MKQTDKNKREVRPLGVFALIMGIIYSIPFFAMFFINSRAAVTIGLGCIPIAVISLSAAKMNFWRMPATNVRVSYIGHRCFKLECDEQSVIIDPYADGSVPGLKPVKGTVNKVLCTDGDWSGVKGLRVKESKRAFPFEITEYEPANGKGKIFMLDNGDHRVVHLGSLSCPLTDEQIEIFKGADILMVPVGGKYSIDEYEAADLTLKIVPEYVLPMSFLAATYGLEDVGYGSFYASAVREGWIREEGNEDKRCPVIVRLAARNGKEKGLASVEVRNREDIINDKSKK